MDRTELAEDRITELEGMIIQVFGKNLILEFGDIMNGLKETSEFRTKHRKEELVSFNREMVRIVVDGMVRKSKLFRNDNGQFSRVDHYRSLCHTFGGDGRCLCCGEFWVRNGDSKYCPKCEEFRPAVPIAVAS